MLNENTTGVLTLFMYLTIPVVGGKVSQNRTQRKILARFGGVTHKEATETTRAFRLFNDIEVDEVIAHWQPHPVEIPLP